MFKIKKGHGLVDKSKLLKQLKKVLRGKLVASKMSKNAGERIYLDGVIEGLEVSLRFIR